MPERRAAKPLEWLPSARAAYLETLDYIARQNEPALTRMGPPALADGPTFSLRS